VERGKCHHEGSGRVFLHDGTTALISVEPDPRAFRANEYTKALLETGNHTNKGEGKEGTRKGDLEKIELKVPKMIALA
jgi:hypothetical protein